MCCSCLLLRQNLPRCVLSAMDSFGNHLSVWTEAMHCPASSSQWLISAASRASRFSSLSSLCTCTSYPIFLSFLYFSVSDLHHGSKAFPTCCYFLSSLSFTDLTSDNSPALLSPCWSHFPEDPRGPLYKKYLFFWEVKSSLKSFPSGLCLFLFLDQTAHIWASGFSYLVLSESQQYKKLWGTHGSNDVKQIN